MVPLGAEVFGFSRHGTAQLVGETRRPGPAGPETYIDVVQQYDRGVVQVLSTQLQHITKPTFLWALLCCSCERVPSIVPPVRNRHSLIRIKDCSSTCYFPT